MSDNISVSYQKDGLIFSLPGTVYQLKLSVLLLKCALDKEYRFKIAAERKEAGKFDDLEIEIINTNTHRLYQLKHLEEATNKITEGDLKTEKDGKFSLQKYFLSYLDIKKSSSASGLSYGLVIYTNVGLENKLKIVFDVPGEDELLDVVCEHHYGSGKLPQLLKLNRTCKERSVYVDLLKKYSDIDQIKMKLINCVEKGTAIDFKDKTLKKYREVLLRDVLDVSTGKFKPEFLSSDSDLSDGAKELRLSLLAKFQNSLYEKTFVINTRIDLFNAGKSEQKLELLELPNDKIDEQDIEDFLNNLVFAVNQPNELELSEIIAKTLGPEFNLIDNGFVASELLEYMLDWTKKLEGTYLTETEGKELFEKIREKISKLAMIGPTEGYCSELESYGVSFECIPSELEEFLKSGVQQIFLLINSYKSVLSSIKVYQTLKNMQKYDRADSYIFSPLKSLLRTPDRVVEAFKSSDLLIIEISTSGVKMEADFADKLLTILLTDDLKKLILIISLEDQSDLPTVITDNSLKIFDDKNSFDDLSKASQDSLLKSKKITFQGHSTQISNSLGHCIDADILFQLINGEQITIGTNIPRLGEVEEQYVDRSFSKIQLKDSILAANEFTVAESGDVDKVAANKDILIYSDKDDDFASLCGRFKHHNVHLIQKEGDEYFWKKSHGSTISKLRKYLVPVEDQKTGLTNLKTLKNNVVIISGPPGMGKSTFLTKSANEFKNYDPNRWVLRVNLVEHSTKLKNQTKPFDLAETMDFLYSLLSRITEKSICTLEREWFGQCLEMGKVILLFDGFDEVSPHYTDKVTELLKTLQKTKVKRVWITNRTFDVCTDLEDQLLVFAHTLNPLEQNSKKRLLINIWKDKFTKQQAEQYAECLMTRFARSTQDWYGVLLLIPLQVKMIAKVFLNAVISENTHLRDKFLTDTNGDINLMELYEQFFDIQFDEVYIEEKNRHLHAGRDEPINVDSIEESRTKFVKHYKRMALYVLFGKVEFDKFYPLKYNKLLKQIDKIDMGRHKLGIIERAIEKLPVFVHRTYAEYFAALALASIEVTQNRHFPEFMHQQVYSAEKETIYRLFAFLMAKNDQFKLKNPIHAAVFGNDASQLTSLCADIKSDDLNRQDDLLGWSPLRLAVQYKFWGMADILLKNGVDSTDMQDTITSKMISSEFIQRLAIGGDLVHVVKTLHERKIFNLSTLHLDRKTSLDLAIERDSINAMLYLKDKCKLTFDVPEYTKAELRIEEKLFLMAITKDAVQIADYLLRTAQVSLTSLMMYTEFDILHLAAYRGALGIVQYILDNFKIDVNVKNRENETPLYAAVEGNSLDVVKYLLERPNIDVSIRHITGNLLEKTIAGKQLEMMKCLVESNKFDINASELAEYAIRCKAVDNLDYIIQNFQPKFNVNPKSGETPAHLAVKSGDVKTIEYLFQTVGISFDAQDNYGRTPLHSAIECGGTQDINVVKYLVDIVKVDITKQDNDQQTALQDALERKRIKPARFLVTQMVAAVPDFDPNDVKSKIGDNLVHLAAEKNDLEAMLYFVRVLEIDPNLQNCFGQTPAHLAAMVGALRVLENLAEMPEITLNARDKQGQTPLHVAKTLTVVSILVKLPNLQIDAQDNKGQTVLHLAVRAGELKAVQFLVAEGGVNVNTQTSVGNTALHLAVVYFKSPRKSWRWKRVHLQPKETSTNRIHKEYAILHFLLGIKQFDIQARNKHGYNLLQLANLKGHWGVLEFIVRTGKFDTDLQNDDGEFLKKAIKRRRIRIIKYIVQVAKFNLNTRDSDGNTLLHLAASKGGPTVTKFLISTKTMNINSRNKDERTILHSSVQSFATLKHIVENKNVSVNDQDINGLTVLHMAVKRRRLDIVRYLVEIAMVNIHIKDSKGQTAKDLAAELNLESIVSYLSSRQTNDQCFTTYIFACVSVCMVAWFVYCKYNH